MRFFVVLLCLFAVNSVASAANLEWIRISPDGKSFVQEPSRKKFVPWGVNYDHDRTGRLLENYWIDEWATVEEDFREIRELGANVVRIHLQTGKFMNSPTEVNEKSLDQLEKLVRLADDTGLYLDLTGLACYKKRENPAWLEGLSESERGAMQAEFWKAVARRCAPHPAVFFYDLINEPAAPVEGKDETEWLFGDFFGSIFGQRIALKTNGRARHDIIRSWIDRMVGAIRSEDKRHLITIGMLPPEFGSGFDPDKISQKLDFIAVHIYPMRDKPQEPMEIVRLFQVGKPLIVEEIYPLGASPDELFAFIDEARPQVAGWISFYWGERIDELKARENKSPFYQQQIEWLEKFKARAKTMTR